MSALQSNIPANLDLECKTVRSVIAHPERLGAAAALRGVIFHARPRLFLDSAVRCGSERLASDALGALTDDLTERKLLDVAGGTVAVIDYAAGAGPDFDFDAAMVELQSLTASREWRERLLAKPTARPVIALRDAHNEMVGEAQVALVANPRTSIFQREHVLVTVRRDEGRLRGGVRRPVGAPIIEPVTVESLMHALDDSAEFVKGSGRTAAPALPQQWLARGVMSAPDHPFPYLAGIVEGPTFTAEGELLALPGYDSRSELLVLPAGEFPPVPERPTAAEVKAALDELFEPLRDFPFLADSDRAATVAALLTLVARFAIDAPSPLFAVRATTPGTGKTLLARVVSLIGTGRPPACRSMPRDDDEMRKALLAIGLAGTPLVLLDNVDGRLASNVLSMALTAGEISDRVLGESKSATATLRTVWMATGNGTTFGGDLGRRVIPVDLDAGMEHPEDRRDFEHKHLDGWVREHRARFVTAALIILRAYHVARRPAHGCGPRMGSFEAWDDLIRGACVWSGVGDPAEGRARIREEGDDDLARLGGALAAWFTAFESEAHTLSEVVATAERRAATDPALRDALTDLVPGRSGLTTTTLGNVLRKVKGRIVGGMCFASGTDKARTGAVRWSVQRVQRVQRVFPTPSMHDPSRAGELDSASAPSASSAPEHRLTGSPAQPAHGDARAGAGASNGSGPDHGAGRAADLHPDGVSGSVSDAADVDGDAAFAAAADEIDEIERARRAREVANA